MKPLVWVVSPLFAAACSSEEQPSVQSTTGGQGGAGGSPLTDPWDKPVCPDPDVPLGGIPAARAYTAGAMDPDGRSLLIFGGDIAIVVCGQNPARDHVGDTWLLDLDTMGPYTNYDDVWTFDFEARAWSQLATSGTGPSARSNTATVVAGGELIVFAGNTSTSGLTFTPQNDLYALDLESGAWRRIAAQNPPSPRLFHTMAYDPEAARVYLVSGGDENAFLGPFIPDVWVLDLASETWHEIPTTGLSAIDQGRIKAGLALRGATEGEGPALFAFAGHDAGQIGARNDVARLDLASLSLPPAGALSWTVVRAGDTYNHKPDPGACDFPPDFTHVDHESPERRQGFAFGQLDDGGAFVVFGGDSDCGRLSDTWWFNTETGVWTPVRESLPSPACAPATPPAPRSAAEVAGAN